MKCKGWECGGFDVKTKNKEEVGGVLGARIAHPNKLEGVIGVW